MEAYLRELCSKTAETTAVCKTCGEPYPAARQQLGYSTCNYCGELAAREVKHTVVPMHKSNYVLITDPTLLVGINSKGTR